MARELILLVGLHKTATTSIQLSCAAHAGALGRAGVSYPVTRATGPNRTNHTEIFNRFREAPGRLGLSGQYKLTDASRARSPEKLDALAQMLSDLPGRVLMAAEGVSLMSVPELMRMKQWFASHGWEIRPVCNVRHLSSWMNSMIAQRVVSPVAFSMAQAVDDYLGHGSIVRRRIENLREVFPGIRFHSHERAVAHPQGPVGAFFDHVGIRLESPALFVRANEGGGDRATRFMSVLNERFGLFTNAGERNPELFVNEKLPAAVRAFGGPKFRLHADEAAPLLPMLHADNEWLRQTLGEEFHDRSLVFTEHRCHWDEGSLLQARRLLAAFPPQVRHWMVANLERIDLPPDK